MKPKIKCLIVDDLEENLLALCALLKEDGVELLTAHSGTEALELLLSHDFALAFLDVQMPAMDGFELAELMRGSARSQNVPIIFVTAGARDQHRMFKGYETGAVDFLYKPIDPYILKNKAEVFFQLHRQKQQLAQELHERTETLRLNEMFIAVLGHDLRNPLQAIVMSADVLRLRSSDEAVQKAAGRILSSGERMNRMIEDLLDLARARLAGGIPLKREPTDLGALVQRVVQDYLAAFPSREIEVRQEGDLAGEWDADRLSQVASNLIGNSFQHGAETEAIHICLDGSASDFVMFSVTNAGSIPADLLPHVFDPFRGTHRQQGRNDGLGLGLYIAQQIVHAHLGSVEVQSDSCQQVLFRVKVPRRTAEIIKL